MFFYYRPKTKDVVMYSETLNKAPGLEVLEITPTPVELEKIKDNYEQKIEDGRLVFKTPAYLEELVKKRDLEKIKEDLDNGATTKSILQRLLATL